jgi:phosphohistidine phosphatase
LLVVRHAIAAERGDDWPDDDLRPLTERGVSRFQMALRGLDWVGIEIDEVWTSPLVRARQTAEMLAAVLGGPPVRALDALAPGHAPEAVAAALDRATRRQRLAVVGHEPGLGELVAWLLGAARPVSFKKGGACRLDVGALSRRGSAELAWFLPPRILRRLSGAHTP